MSLAIPRAIFRPLNLTGYVLSSTVTSEPSLRLRTSSSGPVGLPIDVPAQERGGLGHLVEGQEPRGEQVQPDELALRIAAYRLGHPVPFDEVAADVVEEDAVGGVVEDELEDLAGRPELLLDLAALGGVHELHDRLAAPVPAVAGDEVGRAIDRAQFRRPGGRT